MVVIKKTSIEGACCHNVFKKAANFFHFLQSALFHSNHIFITTLKIFFQSGNISALVHLPWSPGQNC